MENSSSDVPKPSIEVLRPAMESKENGSFGELAVGVASLIGTPLAGGVALAINALRRRQWSGALIALAMGGLLLFTLLGLIQYVSQFITPWVLLPIGAVVMVGVARTLQGDLVTRQRMRGVVMALVIGGVMAGALCFAVKPYLIKKPAKIVMTRMMVTDKQAVNYAAPVIEADARRVAEVLKRVGYFDASGTPKAVFMVGDEMGRPVVIFEADPEKVKNPEVMKLMAVFAQGFVQGGLAMPFTMRLAGPDGKMLKEVHVKLTPATAPGAAGGATTRSGLPALPETH